MQAEQITAPVAYHGEGPCWSASWGGLRFVDMLEGDLLTLREDGEVDRLHVGSPVAAFVRPRANGGYVVGTERGLALADAPDVVPSPALTLWYDEGIRMNEGTVTPDGSLLAGTMAYDRTQGAATVYRVTPGREVEVLITGATISNGIGFSPAGDLAYYNDTPTGRTDVFDVVDGAFERRRPFVDHDGARPDGLCVDSEGNVWVALNGQGTVRCFSPAGDAVAEATVPVRLSTACALGGEDGRDLFVTTSRENLGDDAEPEAGALFRARVDVPGQPVVPFAG